MSTLLYSYIPRVQLKTAGIPELVYILKTGFGDCGTQSTYFATPCRSLGTLARAVGGYQ